MPNDRGRIGARAAAAAALLLVFVATWILLDRSERRPDWLIVEAPEVAVIGRPLEIRVTLKTDVRGGLVDCSLHRANAERKGWGYLASSGPARPAAKGVTYTFSFVVPEREETAFAFALIYLSPTGRWEDGTRAVTAPYMPVRGEGAAGAGAGLRKVPLYRYPTAAETARAKAKPPKPRGRPAAWIHPVLGALLLAAAALAAAAAGPRTAARADRTGERPAWLAIATPLAMSAVFELSGLAGRLTAWGRRLAEGQGVYDLRKPVQEAIIAATAAASLGLFFLFIRAVRRPGSHRFLWWAGIGLAAYLSLSFVSVLSFHAVDAARGMTWYGISPVDALRGAGAAAALGAAWLALRRRKVPVPT
jgi:hypothetical protein